MREDDEDGSVKQQKFMLTLRRPFHIPYQPLAWLARQKGPIKVPRTT